MLHCIFRIFALLQTHKCYLCICISNVINSCTPVVNQPLYYNLFVMHKYLFILILIVTTIFIDCTHIISMLTTVIPVVMTSIVFFRVFLKPEMRKTKYYMYATLSLQYIDYYKCYI